MTDTPQIEYSKLSREVTIGSKSVAVEIYRIDGHPEWHLEVVDEFSNSTAWDSTFITDSEAFDEAQRTISKEGIESLIGPEGGEHKDGWI